MIQWEREVRGYNRAQVDEYVAMQSGQIRELENKLRQGLSEIERLRRDLSEARDAGGRPAHEEIPERVGQILKLAAEQAKEERERGAIDATEMREAAKTETDKLRSDTKLETDQARAHAQDQAERMLAAAAEQSERSVVAAKTEAERLVSTAQATAERTVADATKHADSTVAAAIAQAKEQLDQATARATAIHDGAERRLNLLISRHTETVRRLTEIRDVVTSLVSGEATRGSLEDEVNRALTAQAASNGADGRTGSHDAPQPGAHRTGTRQGVAAAVDGRRAAAAQSAQAAQAAQTAQPAQADSQPVRQAAHAATGAARSASPTSRQRDQSDPMAGDRIDAEAAATAQSADDARDSTDDLGSPANSVRQSVGAPTLATRTSERAIDS
jgi:hypothetical protein